MNQAIDIKTKQLVYALDFQGKPIPKDNLFLCEGYPLCNATVYLTCLNSKYRSPHFSIYPNQQHHPDCECFNNYKEYIPHKNIVEKTDLLQCYTDLATKLFDYSQPIVFDSHSSKNMDPNLQFKINTNPTSTKIKSNQRIVKILKLDSVSKIYKSISILNPSDYVSLGENKVELKYFLIDESTKFLYTKYVPLNQVLLIKIRVLRFDKESETVFVRILNISKSFSVNFKTSLDFKYFINAIFNLYKNLDETNIYFYTMIHENRSILIQSLHQVLFLPKK